MLRVDLLQLREFALRDAGECARRQRIGQLAVGQVIVRILTYLWLWL
jgi:hypothetical protein